MDRRFWLVGLGVAVLATVLSGCAGSQGPEPQILREVSLKPTALPNYTPGTRYQFDNGRLETVLGTEGEVVTWQIGRSGKRTEQRYRNPVLPPLRRQSSKKQVEATFTAPPDSLWPLQVGNSVRFNMRRSQTKLDGDNKRQKRTWSCAVDDAVRLHTKAGPFDSYPIECSRHTNGRSMEWRETKRWFYSPAVGHYVRFEHERRGKPTKSYELVAMGDSNRWYTAPDRQLAAVIQPALERNRSDQPLTKIVEAGYRVTVTPIETWKNSEDQYCRDFTVIVEGSKSLGTACRQANGHWEAAPDPS